jgi:hypothetical protein
MFCGGSIVVREAIHAAVIANVSNWAHLAGVARKSSNFAEAYSYYTRILEVEPYNHDAWFGKGEAAGWLYTPGQNRLAEMLTLFQAAVDNAPPEIRPQMIARTNSAIAVITLNAYRTACQHAANLGAGAASSHISDCSYMVGLMEQTHKYAPHDRQILEGILWVCTDILNTKYYPSQRSNQYRTWVERHSLLLSSEQQKALRQKVTYYEYVLRQLPVG